MKLNNEMLDAIYDYINGENYLFYSDCMVGKTNAQFDYLIRYLYDNGGNVLLLCKNRNTIDKLSEKINKYNNPYKLVKYIYPDEIYFGNSHIKIINNGEFLMDKIRGKNIDILVIDDFNLSFKIDIEYIEKLCSELYVNGTKIILNGTITNNKNLLDKLNLLKCLFKFKEVNNEFMVFIKRRCKIEKIKKRIE